MQNLSELQRVAHTDQWETVVIGWRVQESSTIAALQRAVIKPTRMSLSLLAVLSSSCSHTWSLCVQDTWLPWRAVWVNALNAKWYISPWQWALHSCSQRCKVTHTYTIGHIINTHTHILFDWRRRFKRSWRCNNVTWMHLRNKKPVTSAHTETVRVTQEVVLLRWQIFTAVRRPHRESTDQVYWSIRAILIFYISLHL